ncbi:helix-turn-helix domain-containing protein [Pseudoalteromonas pernae]
MDLMTSEQVADYLDVKVERVKRLAREHLLIARSKDDNGDPMFEKGDVEKYKELAQRLGGI